MGRGEETCLGPRGQHTLLFKTKNQNRRKSRVKTQGSTLVQPSPPHLANIPQIHVSQVVQTPTPSPCGVQTFGPHNSPRSTTPRHTTHTTRNHNHATTRCHLQAYQILSSVQAHIRNRKASVSISDLFPNPITRFVIVEASKCDCVM